MYEKIRERKLKTQFIFFNVVFNVVDILIWSFYLILLYRETQSVLVLSIDMFVYYLAFYLGVIWGGVLLEKKGYREAFKIHNLLSAITVMMILLFLPQIGGLFIIFSLMRGMSRGIYWTVIKNFFLRENKGENRESFVNVMSSILLVLSVVVPTLSGALISYSHGYEFNLLLGGILYLVAGLFPWKYNKVTRSNFNLSEVVQILGMKGFKQYAALNIFNGFNDMVPTLIFGIVPFLIIRNELGVGVFISAVSLLGALVLYIDRKDKIKNRVRVGFISFIIEGLSNLYFIFSWSLIGLAIKSILYQFFGSIGLAVIDDVDYENRDVILGKQEKESAVEFNLVTETMLLIGRILSITLFIIILVYSESDVQLAVRIFLGLTAFWNLAILFWQVKLHKRLTGERIKLK